MNPFLFLFTIVYLTPSISCRALIAQNHNLQSHPGPESHEALTPAGGHRRSKRSLTAFLTAEVLFLEGLLAAQNSRKPRKISRPVLVNTIESNGHGHGHSQGRVNKHFLSSLHQPHQPHHQLFHFRPRPQHPPPPPPPPPPPAPPVTTTTVSSLDPFIMLSAPDLSKNNPRDFHQQQQQQQPQQHHQQHQQLHQSRQTEPEIITAPTTTFHAHPASFSARKPKKRTLRHYGAFELYHL